VIRIALVVCLIASISLAPVAFGQALPPHIFQPKTETPPPLEDSQGQTIGTIYATGNGRTKERVIVQEMLLRPGDPFDVELAQESVRNIRAFDYLSAAEIIPHPNPENGTVDLEVAVKDSWPWVGAIIPNFAGGQQELGMIVANGNFLGRGQAIGITALLSSEVADSYSFFFLEPRMVGSRWGLGLSLGKQGDVGNRNRISLFRPLYSLSARWGYELAVFDEAEERLLYDAGVTVSNYYRQRRGGMASAVRRFRDGDRRLEVGLRYLFLDDEHEQAPGLAGGLPEDKQRATLTLETTAERLRFVEDRYFNLMGPVEDLRLGLRGTLRLGGAATALGSDRNYPELGFGFRWFEGTPPSGYVLAEADVNTRVEDGEFANTVLLSTLRGYRKLPGQGMLAANAQVTVIDKMEDPEQLLLDSPNGLRGYEANSFNGTRRFLSNLEWRQPFWRLSWLNLASVVFVDGGIIWSEVARFEDAPFLVGAGLGVRFGFPGLLGAPVTRLDWGYGFETGSSEISFGFDQRF
jgi:outer membrane protein assembly factor BamA